MSARSDAARQLRRFLDAVRAGALSTDTGHDRAILRRIEGAISGLEATRKRR